MSIVIAGETNVIQVHNMPSKDDKIIACYFESTTRNKGGPVKSVKIVADSNCAIVDFEQAEGILLHSSFA